VLDAKAATHDIEFATAITLADDLFEADRSALRSILVNMIDNSFDACRLDKQKSDHAVSLKVDGDDQELRFTLTDNGLGMTKEVQEKAFTLFFSSKGSGGTGLGLFLAHKMVQAHSGRIELTSEPGQGTRFVIVLPRKQPLREPSVEISPGATDSRPRDGDQEAAWKATLDGMGGSGL
jgi:signal transduction histidine kinase